MDKKVRTAIEDAGVARWPKLFQALRSSCETEWKVKYPEPFVLLWIGHTEKVSRKHYVRQTPDILWDQVAGRAGPGAAQNPAQHRAESTRTEPKSKMPPDAGVSHNSASDGILSQLLVTQGDGGGGNQKSTFAPFFTLRMRLTHVESDTESDTARRIRYSI